MQRAQISVSVWRNIARVYREGDQDCNQGQRERNGCRVARARVHIANKSFDMALSTWETEHYGKDHACLGGSYLRSH
jgi:hypothetical protein